MVQRATYESPEELLAVGEPEAAYSLLNWIGNQTGFGIYFVNFVCAAMFSWGLLTFCQRQPRPWLALVVAVPFLVVVVSMGTTRQAVAISLIMIGMVRLLENKIVSFLIFIVLATTFHKTAVILIALAILAKTRQLLWKVFWVIPMSLLFYLVFLEASVDSFIRIYIEAEYNSDAANIRVAMNAFPAILFLLLRYRFVMLEADRIFWTWMSLSALVLVGLLAVSPSSNAVDRMSLYWIPLQLFVLSRLPDALGRQKGRNAVWVCVVVGYSATVQFIWLFFANHAEYYIPYQFYPWVLLWN
jgi:hypothetical protein